MFQNTRYGAIPLSWIAPNGILDNYVNPIFGATSAPPGTYFPGPSDRRKTVVENNPSAPGETRYTRGWKIDKTGYPFMPSEPGWTAGGSDLAEPEDASKMHAIESATDTSDPRSPAIRGADVSFNLESLVKSTYAYSPIATVFWGLAVLWLASELFLNQSSSTASKVGSSVASVGQTVTKGTGNVAKSVVEETSSAAGKIVDAAADAVDAVVPG